MTAVSAETGFDYRKLIADLGSQQPDRIEDEWISAIALTNSVTDCGLSMYKLCRVGGGIARGRRERK